MKKLFAMMAACAMLAIFMAACNTQPTDTTADETQIPSTNPWTDECTEPNESTAPSEAETTAPAEDDDSGEAHIHTATGSWQVDITGHWKECDECGEKVEAAEHQPNDDGICSVCNSTVTDWGDSIDVCVYDEYDNLIRMLEYDENGELVSEYICIYVYDENGNMTFATEYIDDRLTGETEYTVVDGESIPVRYVGYDEDGRLVNEYDHNGNVVYMAIYDTDDNQIFSAVSEYEQDEDGIWYESSCTETDEDGNKTSSQYNEYGDIIGKICMDCNDNVLSVESWEHTYEENRLIIQSLYTKDNETQLWEFKVVVGDDWAYSYMEKRTTYNEDGTTTVCTYDENENLLSEVTYDVDGNPIE